MRRLTTVGVLSILVILMAATTQASSITLLGSDIDGAAADWRTDTATKPLDADGDNIYGTDGWAMWLPTVGQFITPASLARVSSSLPSYVSDFAEDAPTATRWNGYAMIDDPNNMPTDVCSGTLTSSKRTPGSTLTLAHFEVNSSVAGLDYLVFGIMCDNLNGTIYLPTSFTLESSVSGSASVTTTESNKTADMYLFKIEDAQAGEVFTLSGVVNANGYSTAGAALTWDNVATEVPEPSTLVLLLGGMTLLVFRRMKR